MTRLRLAASNIGWKAGDDARVLSSMAELGYSGLEVAPSRIFPEEPYARPGGAARYAEGVRAGFGLEVCSMQSIWFGRGESLFDPDGARALLAHTRRAVDFAHAMECPNIVFGCPRNRSVPEGRRAEEALGFFRACGRYARERGVTIALEANPPAYGTNFMNTTREAVAFMRAVASEGVALNLDLGAVLANGEPDADVLDAAPWASHVHVSEPGLAPVRERGVHRLAARALEGSGYGGFVSLEMRAEEAAVVEGCLEYVAGAFG